MSGDASYVGDVEAPPVHRAIRIVAMMTVAAMLAKKRVIFLLVLLAIPPFIATVAKTSGASVEDCMVIPPVALFLFIAPMVTLFHGTSVFADEVDGRTLGYLLMRPISREALLAGKLLGTWLVSAALVCGSALIVHLPLAWTGTMGGLLRSELWGDAAAFGAVLALGIGLYALFSTLLGLLLKHPTLAGIVYILVVEVLFCWAPGPPSKMAMSYHLLRLVPDRYVTSEETVAIEMGVGVMAPDSWTTALGLSVVAAMLLAGCVAAVKSSDFSSESDQ